MLVFDAGSSWMKAGFGGDDTPRAVFPLHVGRRFQPSLHSDRYVGDDASTIRNLTISHPMKHGIVTNWADMEMVWHHTFFNELRESPEEHSLMMSHAPSAPDADLEKTAEIMFETFNVLQLSTVNAGVLSLFPSGCYTGVCLHLGETTQYCVPVQNACPIPHGSLFSPHGCNDVVVEMKRLLAEEKVCDFRDEKLGHWTWHIAVDIVQNMASMSDAELAPKVYELPDGNVISISHSARTRCTDVLFHTQEVDPSASPPSEGLLGICHAFLLLNILPYDVTTHAAVPSHFVPYDGVLEGLLRYIPGPKVRPWRGGIHDMLLACLQYCDSVEMSLLEELAPRVVLCGGGSKLKGLAQRLQNEVARRLECSEARVASRPDGQYLKWIGGSLASMIPNFPAVTVGEYNEGGPQVVHTKINVFRPLPERL